MIGNIFCSVLFSDFVTTQPFRFHKNIMIACQFKKTHKFQMLILTILVCISLARAADIGKYIGRHSRLIRRKHLSSQEFSLSNKIDIFPF